MPNIKQQKKRVRTAAQERLENLRYRSTAKTLAKRLEAAVNPATRTGSSRSTASSFAGSIEPQHEAHFTGTPRRAEKRKPRGSFPASGR